MGWRDDLRPASFRGVPFQIEDHNLTGGRRGPLHEYPGRDVPFRQDLGRKARRYRVRAFVIGEEYMAARDRLLRALETPGPGILIHPYFGAVNVAVTEQGFSLLETNRRGRLAEFVISFVDAGENRLPRAGTDRASTVNKTSDTASNAVKSRFKDRFDAKNRPAFVATAAVGYVKALSQSLSTATRTAKSIGSLGALDSALSAIDADAPTLVTETGNLADRVTALFGIAGVASATPRDGANNLVKLSSFGATFAAVPTNTEVRRAEGQNQDAFTALARRGALIDAARLSPDAAFDTFGEATRFRDALTGAIDAEAISAGEARDDASYLALSALSAAVAADITARAADLSRVVEILPAVTAPVQVIAHRLYGDAGRADEVRNLNNIAHPGFVPGGETLRVTDG